MMERASICVWFGDRFCLETVATLPSIFIAGGEPVVINRSDPSLLTIMRSKSCIKLIALLRSIRLPC